MKRHDILCCPKCKASLRGPSEGAGTEGVDGWWCSACGVEYPAADGVIDFLPGRSGGKGPAQKLMESERMVAIYESRWWRASRLFGWFMGIGLEAEMSLIKRIAQLGPRDTVLDLACGPGLYARSFAADAPGRSVFGLDVSWPMLRYAAGKAHRLGVRNVCFLHGDAHALPFQDATLDAANSCGALHLFSDIRRVLGELHRVLRPGGRFSGALAMRTSKPLNRFKAYGDEKFWGIHYYRPEQFKSLLDEAGFEPAVHHARRIWMVVGGVRRP